jgi:hypothetical protein
MSEVDEIAALIDAQAVRNAKDWDSAVALSKATLFADETQTVIDNLAESIMRRAKRLQKAPD